MAIFCVLSFLATNGEESQICERLVSFPDQENLDYHEDTSFDCLIDKLNESLPAGWYVDGEIEVYSILDENPKDQNVIVVSE